MNLISRRHLLMSAASLLPAGRLAWAQRPTYSADVKVVNVFATVRDKHGKIVRNLTADDFKLEEDGRPQVIRYFSRETDLPLTLGLMVDTSGSQRRVLGAERSASERFLTQVLREDKDQAFLLHFDTEVELLQDLTSSRKPLIAALSNLDAPQMERRGQSGSGDSGSGYPSGGGRRGQGRGRGRGGTALYDAVLLASDDLMRKQKGRKALILLSDGVDNGSKVTLSTAIEAAQRADTLVDSILFKSSEGSGGGYPGGMGGRGMGGRHGGGRGGMGGGPGRYPQSRPDGKKILQQISKETGGTFFEVSKKQPIDKIYDLIEEDLRSQYSLGFTSDRQDSNTGYRLIHLAAKNAKLTVVAREGYYPAGS